MNIKYTNILDILENTAKRIPDNVAFEDEKMSVSYVSFVENSKKIGTGLAAYFTVGQPVPIFMEKSVKTLEVMFGAVYAGCFYTIIDVHHPLARINSIMETLKADVMVTGSEYVEAIRKTGYQGRILIIEEILEDIAVDSDKLNKIREQHIPKSPLYCNFTSGSTGVPKGVLVGHESVIDFISCFTEQFNITENDVIGNQAPFDFDVSVKDIYSTIFTGAKMVIIPKRKFSFPMELMDYLCERKITTLVWAVSALCIISTLNGFTYKVPEKVNKVIFSGEVMPVKHLNIWRKYLPYAMYVNVYGPTEITCNCTYYVIGKNEFTDKNDKIPIGKAFPNEDVFLVNDADEIVCNPGAEGEICVSGICLALGYYNNKSQTDKAFVKSVREKDKIMYRTGDLGIYDETGNLVYVGRKDFQIKHMGHRIELGEIEQAMGDIKEITRVCVIFDKENNCMVAFYSGDIDKRDIKRQLRNTLPVFMIPTKFDKIEEFPLNKNGKIDRNKLMDDWKQKSDKNIREKKNAVENAAGKSAGTENLTTPAFVFDEDILNEHVDKLQKNLGKSAKVCYAMKANPFLIRSIRDRVPYFEVCSPGELRICRRADIPAEKIVLSGVYKEESDMDFALKEYGVRTFTIESYNQYKLLEKLTNKYDIKIHLIIRITSGNQFGVDREQLPIILGECKNNSLVTVDGLQMYSGTQKKKTKIIEDEVRGLFELADESEKIYGSSFTKIEYGPGIFVPYFVNDTDNENELLESLKAALDSVNKEHKRSVILEMGRYVAASCGKYISRIVDIKENNGQKYCIIDGGINHLNYYGQTMSMKMMHFKHLRGNKVISTNEKIVEGESDKYNICGSLCTVADVIVKNMELNSPEIGDAIVFENTGAYSVTEGIYLFLSRSMPVIAMNSKTDGLRIVRDVFETHTLNGIN